MALNMTGSNLWWQARLDNTLLKKDAVQTGSIFQTLGKSISKANIFAGVAVAAVVAIGAIAKANIKFEKSISVLSSLTGAVGKDLDFYKKKAIEYGEVTTQTASQVADAFKLIGSQMPILLQNKEALANVTKQAIILSEAAQIDVPTAARAMTNSLNQMGAGAHRASEFINILAAGSKLGAADIPYLNAAIEKSGKVAKDANLSYSELVSIIEKIAPAMSEPSSAGLHFRTVLLRLQKQGYGFSSGMFDLQEALNEVKTELDGIVDPAKRVAKETDIMGIRSITVGKVMLENKDIFKEFSKELEGTNTAYEQAEINTDNVAGSYLKLKSAIEGIMLRLGQGGGLNDLMQGTLDTSTDLLLSISQLIGIFRELAPETENQSEGLKEYNETVKKHNNLLKLTIRYYIAVIKYAKEALEFFNLLDNDADRRKQMVISRVDDMVKAFKALDEKSQLRGIADFKRINEQFQKTGDLVKYTEAMNKLLSLLRGDNKYDLGDVGGGGGGGDNGDGDGDGDDSEFKKALRDFELFQDLELSRYKLITENEEAITLFKQQQLIERLEAELLYNRLLAENENTEIINETIQNKIDLLEQERNLLLENSTIAIGKAKLEKEAMDPLIEAQNRYLESLKKTGEEVKELSKGAKVSIHAFAILGTAIAESFEDGEFSAKKFTETLRTETLKVISILIAKAVVSAVAKLFETTNPIVALILAAPVGAAVYGVMNAVIPKFATGKPADFTGGGVVPGTGHRDSQMGQFQPNEIVMNPKQQANVLWSIAKGGMSNNKVESLLSEQNDLLRNAKHFVIKDNKMFEVINGRTTAKTLLE